ncbi:hybrid sensor histidine kinase/response regulator [Aureliella helgolandensis]|uniref:histidine kinase n=1 Tax=Aureliella helgolandensis TaxID=2527968 RepID=A0A518G5X9_9BACT|nr:chemotaxis protein CheW [Aureliella helgolandensis]QDV23997.1 Chemotaxis protein CheA [Aureliella helgolandensis]
MFQDDEILQEFVSESSEQLANIEEELLAIETQGEHADLELVNKVFRAIHSIKGAAGFLGLSKINELSHSLENILNRMRCRELIPTTEVTEALLRSADVLRNLIADVGNSNAVDVSANIGLLDLIYAQSCRLQATPESAGSDAVETPHPSVAQESHWTSDTPHSKRVQAIAFPAKPLTLPPVAPGEGSDAEGCEESSGRALLQLARQLRADIESAFPPDSSSPAPSHAPAWATEEHLAQDLNSLHARPDASVRVSVVVLDRLMNLAGELVLSRNQLLQAVEDAEQEKLRSATSRIDHVTSELQDAIMQTRMQPVSTVFNRLPRLVRDLSNKLDKKCNLVINGGEVELDKTIIEAIGAPLTHLIRNCIDHGIESPSQRYADGKVEEGEIRLRAYHQAGKVCIRLEDDGRGIDVEAIKTKAVDLRLLDATSSASLSAAEALRLIFAPGFSTSTAVTDVSGRGVGMDVVQTNIEEIGGTVDIETELGKGTAVHITLPLTLAIIPSLIVGVDEERYAIPQSNITELIRIPRAESSQRLGDVQGAEVLRLRGQLLPIVRLSTILKTDNTKNSDSEMAINIVVVEAGQYRYGILVDRLFDNEEIVVKPLGTKLSCLDCLAGATILGDGRVALILDVTGVACMAKIRTEDSHVCPTAVPASAAGLSELHSVLFFRNSEEEQFAIPMSTVRRIKRIEVKALQRLGSQLLLSYRGSTIPLIELEQYVAAKPRNASLRHVSIVVFRVGVHEVGLIAPLLGDIGEVELDVGSSTVGEKGVSGIVAVDGVPTRLLDVIDVLKSAFPSLVQQDAKNIETAGKHILVAEDSDFFRRHLEKTLGEEGYSVTSCRDGQEAWNRLEDMETLPYALITDIEMPGMTGLELTTRVRGNQRTAPLPIIALSSLAGDEDIKRGRQAGVNEYEIKLDRESLLQKLLHLN